MKANIQLSLRTREVYKLFERKINDDRLFIDAILHKINKVITCCKNQEPQSTENYNHIEKKILSLTQQFAEETARFELLLSKKNFDNKEVNFIVQFHPTLTISNPLAMQLVHFIEIYDKFVAILKLLHIAGCFETDKAYFGNLHRYQKMVNQVLSTFLLIPSAKLEPCKY